MLIDKASHQPEDHNQITQQTTINELSSDSYSEEDEVESMEQVTYNHLGLPTFTHPNDNTQNDLDVSQLSTHQRIINDTFEFNEIKTFTILALLLA